MSGSGSPLIRLTGSNGRLVSSTVSAKRSLVPPFLQWAAAIVG